MKLFADPTRNLFIRLEPTNQIRDFEFQIITGVSFTDRKNGKKRKIHQKTIEKNGKMKSLQVRVPTMGIGRGRLSLLSDIPGKILEREIIISKIFWG